MARSEVLTYYSVTAPTGDEFIVKAYNSEEAIAKAMPMIQSPWRDEATGWTVSVLGEFGVDILEVPPNLWRRNGSR